MNVLWSRSFTLVIIITFFLYTGYNIFIATLPLQIKNMGGNPTQISLVVSLFALAALISRPVAGFLVDKCGREKNLVVNLIAITLIALGFSFHLRK